MICYYCHQDIAEELNLMNLFSKRYPLCGSCRQKLSFWREGKRCGHCHHLMTNGERKCLDCKFLRKTYKPVNRITCMLDYNEDVKKLFHRYKFVRDIALREVLAMFLKYDFREYDVIIPVPVSPGRLKERGYDQTSAVLDHLNIKYRNILMTQKMKRQSELGKVARLRGENPFRFTSDHVQCNLNDMRVLIVDDIYTTGITAHQAASLIYSKSPLSIDVLTFSKA